MDRRSFFKTVSSTLVTAPLLAPYVLASKKTHASRELFVISDEPHRYLPVIIRQAGGTSGGRFFFLDSHPLSGKVAERLSGSGWKSAETAQSADITLAFRPLADDARPSFTVVEKGRIRDLRRRSLLQVWKEMSSGGKKSRLLTTVSFREDAPAGRQGKQAALYRNGRLIARLPLGKNTKKSLTTENGLLTVTVENGTARVDHSSCRHKICVATPPVTFAGERIICAPNHFLLEIEGFSNGVDTVIG
jgi:hypothetical protein